MGTEFSVGEDKSSGGGWCDGCTTMPTPIMQQPYHLEIANFTYALPHTHTHKYFSENCRQAGFGSGEIEFSILNMEELFFFFSQDLFFLVYIRKFRIEN